MFDRRKYVLFLTNTLIKFGKVCAESDVTVLHRHSLHTCTPVHWFINSPDYLLLFHMFQFSHNFTQHRELNSPRSEKWIYRIEPVQRWIQWGLPCNPPVHGNRNGKASRIYIGLSKTGVWKGIELTEYIAGGSESLDEHCRGIKPQIHTQGVISGFSGLDEWGIPWQLKGPIVESHFPSGPWRTRLGWEKSRLDCSICHGRKPLRSQWHQASYNCHHDW